MSEYYGDDEPMGVHVKGLKAQVSFYIEEIVALHRRVIELEDKLLDVEEELARLRGTDV